MRIRPECVRDIEEDIDFTTRREPIRRPDFYPRPYGCGYRHRREPFIPQTPTYEHDKWPFYTFDKPNTIEPAGESDIYEIDLGLNVRHDRRLDAAQDLGRAIVAQWDTLAVAEPEL